uniref:Uncharacterized protein n=1 Tax=Cyanothece sp. (strain PCC 7425 / ATCC 29141) TaxID=395961 RepID=B8HZP6_CYAP4
MGDAKEYELFLQEIQQIDNLIDNLTKLHYGTLINDSSYDELQDLQKAQSFYGIDSGCVRFCATQP